MSSLDAALSRLREFEGVERLILLGHDGLVVRQLGGSAEDHEVIAAGVPGLAAAARTLGGSAGTGPFRTGVLEFERGVIIVLSLSPELLLALVLRPGVGFAPLLAELRRQRQRLIELL